MGAENRHGFIAAWWGMSLVPSLSSLPSKSKFRVICGDGISLTHPPPTAAGWGGAREEVIFIKTEQQGEVSMVLTEGEKNQLYKFLNDLFTSNSNLVLVIGIGILLVPSGLDEMLRFKCGLSFITTGFFLRIMVATWEFALKVPDHIIEKKPDIGNWTLIGSFVIFGLLLLFGLRLIYSYPDWDWFWLSS